MPTELETQIASLAVEMVPNIDKIRFVNSRYRRPVLRRYSLARGFTNKR
jgi:glutamate-1-semialdehyde 2,1-aminomutase